jgi:hypothetical protein
MLGRGILIVASGATVIFGSIQLGLLGQKKSVNEATADYAYENHIKNAAYNGLQLGMEELGKDENWSATESSPWTTTIDDVDVTVYYENLGMGATPLDADTVRVYSSALYKGETANLVSTYTRTPLDIVPEFNSALSLTTNKFKFNLLGGSTIRGNDASGVCTDKPGVIVKDLVSSTKVVLGAGLNIINILSTVTQIQIDPSISYDATASLVANLEGKPGVVNVNGSYNGNFGTAANPGVFFVDNYANVTSGVTSGYGIMIIRSGGELNYSGSTSVSTSLEFNGLVVFEDALDFNGFNTPSVNGSVIVGSVGGSSLLDMYLGGGLDIQYDCSAQDHAKIAAANLLKENKYKRLSTFE